MSQSRIGRFLVVLSGARPEILDRCPSERIKFQSLGWALLITCGVATLSMWFALTSAMGFSPVEAFPIAIIWGLIIIGIDRWLVTSTPIGGKGKFPAAAPRLVLALVLALLLGSLISTPIVLRIFESEINNQISVIKENNEAAFLGSQQHSAIAARVNQWRTTVGNYDRVIDSNGAQPVDLLADPVLQALTKQLSSERQAAMADYGAWQCQLYGTCGAPRGSGPLAAASEQRYNADEQQIASLNSQISKRDKQLQTTSVGSQQIRWQQAKAALPRAQAQLAAATAEENGLLYNCQVTNNSSNGLPIRLKALDQLSAGQSTLQVTGILLFLLFLVIGVLPVSVKLLQQPGNYEEVLRKATNRELRQAEWDLRGQPVGAVPVSVLDDLRSPADTVSDGRGSRGMRDSLDEDVMKLWVPTRVEPITDQVTSAETADYERRTDDMTGPNGLNEALLRMKDTRSTDGLDWHQDGIERRGHDGDL
jgi:hypothetical protein